MLITRKDINVISIIVADHINEKDEYKTKLRSLDNELIEKHIAKRKRESILNIINKILTNQDYSTGCHIEFEAGCTSYSDIFNVEEAYQKALKDPFVAGRKILMIRPKFNCFCNYDYIDFIKKLGYEVK